MLRRTAVVLLLLVLPACTATPGPAASGPPSNPPIQRVTTPPSETPVPSTTLETPTSTAPEQSLVLATDAAGTDLLFIDPADPDSPVKESLPVGAAPWDVYVAGDRAFV